METLHGTSLPVTRFFFTMGFVFALLGYLALVTTAVVVIVTSVAYIFPGPQPLRSERQATNVTELSAQKSDVAKTLSPRELTRQLAERAATRR